MPQPLRLLIVEDSLNDAELFIEELRRSGFEPIWHLVKTQKDFLDNLQPDLDIILSDYEMPQFNGLQAYELLQQSGLNLPFILISGSIGEDLAVEAMKRGVNDYLLKDRLARLGQAVQHALQQQRLRDERRQIDEALRESEKFNSAVLNSLLAHVAVLDCEGKILAVNEAWNHFARENGILDAQTMQSVGVGANYLEVCRTSSGEFAEEAQAAYDGIKSVMVGERKSFSLEYPCHNQQQKQWFLMNVSPLTTKQGGVVVSHTNITERRQAETEALASTARLKLALAASRMNVWEWDVATDKVFWSSEYDKNLDIKGSDGSSNFFRNLLHPDDSAKVIKAMEKALASGEAFAEEFRFLRPDGTSIWVTSLAQAEYDENGQPLRMIGTVRDVTERRQLKEQLAQSQKMEAIGRLAGGIAHDFNNLLTVIIGYSQLSMNHLPANDSAANYIQQIEQAGRRAASLTSQLLAFSRKQILQPVIFNLNTAVSDMQKMLHRLIGEDITLETQLAPDLGFVKADPGQIGQIIINLAVNARDAMPQGGKLTIETANLEPDNLPAHSAATAQAKQYILLTIKDTGCGMDEETQAHIFEPFFTTKENGTGLGLSTVYGIVNQTGGSISVSSKAHQGCCFKIYLPRVQTLDESDQTQQKTLETPQACETILLVEDEEIVRNLAKRILEMNGYTVLEAGNADEAIWIYQHYEEPIHLMITDIVMPGLSGRALAERLLQLGHEIKVLYMSGYTEDTIVHHGVSDADMPFLQKPFTPDTLTSKVREVLSEPAK